MLGQGISRRTRIKMSKIEYIGKINNWMDLRDLLLVALKECDNEIKFDKFITGIIISFGVSPEGMNEVRKSVGCKEFSKKDIKKLNKFLEEEKKGKRNIYK